MGRGPCPCLHATPKVRRLLLSFPRSPCSLPAGCFPKKRVLHLRTARAADHLCLCHPVGLFCRPVSHLRTVRAVHPRIVPAVLLRRLCRPVNRLCLFPHHRVPFDFASSLALTFVLQETFVGTWQRSVKVFKEVLRKRSVKPKCQTVSNPQNQKGSTYCSYIFRSSGPIVEGSGASL